MADSVAKPIDSMIAQTRERIQRYVFPRLESRKPKVPGRKIARTVAVTSGKGGVGKTNLVANMAISLAQSGKRVIILDADLGLANIDVVFGIRPKRNIMDVISGSFRLEQILIPGPCGIQIIAGGSGIAELAHLDQKRVESLFEQMRFLEDRADYLLIDTGAGIAPTIISFCLAADQIIVVTNPEPTALADAYGIIKIISQHRSDAYVGVLVNRAESEQEAGFIHERLVKVAGDFLQFPVHRFGFVPQDKQMYLAVRQQTPLLLFSPTSAASNAIRRVVHQVFNLSSNEELPQQEGISGFFQRLNALFRGGQTE
ncbi:MAG TPA: MinD/ParA family protein [Candidatus Ozemobacteraceae bacterium]|nr:MinD/ParA family protein [Candidatus Ozemobacteraceae bacterium]